MYWKVSSSWDSCVSDCGGRCCVIWGWELSSSSCVTLGSGGLATLRGVAGVFVGTLRIDGGVGTTLCWGSGGAGCIVVVERVEFVAELCNNWVRSLS